MRKNRSTKPKSFQRAETRSASSNAPSSSLTRRKFLGSMSGAAVASLAASAIALEPVVGSKGSIAKANEVGPVTGTARQTAARQVRRDAAQLAFNRGIPAHPCNGEESAYGGTFVANFTKALPHNSFGEVSPSAYNALLAALTSGNNADFEAIPLGGVRPLRNPQAGLAFDLEGADSHALAIRPAPRVDGPENSSEAGELYWMALARDVNFTDYANNQLIADAARDLSKFSDFRGPKVGHRVRPATIFRGNTPGDLAGPYLSQFLLLDIPYGSLTISQRQTAVLPPAQGGADYMTDVASWLSIQNGNNPAASPVLDPTPRFIRNGRDISRYVQVDALYEAYLNACLILLGMNAPFDPGLPYTTPGKQDGFATFGGPHILSLLTEVATRGLKAVWYEKWSVHRRARPEAFGGLVHFQITQNRYPFVDREILRSDSLSRTFSQFGTYLLPQAYPEGSPVHPAYGAGHATVAGACVTILKAWFDESFVIPNPVVPSSDGLALVPFVGGPALTVGGELNKVASNVAFGRDFAAIHWRTDASESFTLGEQIAITILEEQKATYNEIHSFSLTKFDGTTITI